MEKSEQKDFNNERIAIIKSRTRSLSILFTLLYVFFNALMYFISKGTFNPNVFGVWMFLALMTLVVNSLNRHVSSFSQARKNLYFFVIPLLFAAMASLIFSPQQAAFGGFIFAITLLSICFLVPLGLFDVTVIFILHFICLLMIHWWSIGLPLEITTIPVDFDILVNKLMFLVIAYVICMFVRKKDNARDLEAFILIRQIKKNSHQLEKELELAKDVQKSLIPKSVSNDLADITVTYLPMHYVGGDYAKFYFIDENRLVFIISDITGHGVSSALLVNRLHSEVERLIREEMRPGELLQNLNLFVKESFGGTGMYLSAFCGLLDYQTGKIYYSNYGHPPQFLYQTKTGALDYLKPQTTFLGLQLAGEGTYEEEIAFSRGNRIILYTDGVTETKGKDGQVYGIERLEKFVRMQKNRNAEDFSKNLVDDLSAFRVGEISDDIYLLVIDIK